MGVILYYQILILPIVYSNPLSSLINCESNQLWISNRCQYSVWPAISTQAQLPQTEGFELKYSETKVIQIPENWSGQIWSRSGCQYSEDSSCFFICDTGDCDSGYFCKNSSGAPPITTAEISYGVSYQDEIIDEYRVNMIKGYNLQIQIRPVEGCHIKLTYNRFDCNLAGCFKDLNSVCPEPLSFRSRKSGSVVGCVNPCTKYLESYNKNSNESKLYNICKKNFIASKYLSMVEEFCPDVSVYENQSNGLYRCRKNLNGFSAYEVIFCP